MSLTIPNAAISALQTIASRLRPETVQVQRRTDTSDGAGGSTVAWNTIATVSGRVGEPTRRLPQEQEIAARLGVDTLYSVTVPALTDVLPKDRLVVGSRTFEVVTAKAPSYEVERKCVCVEVY